MTDLDHKLYDLFPTEDIEIIDSFDEKKLTFRRPPESHDIFRVAKTKNISLQSLCEMMYPSSMGLWKSDKRGWEIVGSYDSSESLLSQSDETKQAIISLFE